MDSLINIRTILIHSLQMLDEPVDRLGLRLTGVPVAAGTTLPPLECTHQCGDRAGAGVYVPVAKSTEQYSAWALTNKWTGCVSLDPRSSTHKHSSLPEHRPLVLSVTHAWKRFPLRIRIGGSDADR